MPSIADRLVQSDSLYNYQPASSSPYQSVNPMAYSGSPATFQVTSTSTNLMSINQGNSVPMRGVPPIETMSDCDQYRFFPSTAYFDRIWGYTYYALANRS